MNIKFLFNSRFFVLLLCSVILFSCAGGEKEKEYTAYLFTYFTGNGDGEEAIRYAVSDDGYNFYALNNNNRRIDKLNIANGGSLFRLTNASANFGYSFSSKTFGKENGHGLGLYHAKETIESWGGAISINSEVGKGTKITIELPLSEPNSWFLSSITLKPETKIVVLDDDPSIHQVWKERFRPLNYQIISFSEPSSFKSYIKGLPNLDNTLVLSDYELIGYSETGIDLIRELDIAENCILVTSHYDESGIIESCKGLNLRLVPKSMAGIVPISVTEASKFDLVYMDDDKYLRMAWELKAKKQNKKILSVGELSTLESNLSNIDFETPFFLDRDLGEGLPKGEDIAKDLFEKGFKNLYLCTGYRKEDLQEFPWIKEILPKNVDFENFLS